ncbi:MAG: GNAT family N-acetyltransferase [Spirochaetaceae bacterium]|nr:GNAT family N-acetyltransferase [Spirochaetaceae bacterium]
MICSVIKEDYPNLLKVWEKVVKETYDFLTEEDFEFYKFRVPYYFNNLSLFAYRDTKGKIKGFLGVSKDKVEMLFLENAFRGKGIGKNLMNFAVNNLKINKVDVNEQNKNAVSFFNHLGYKEIGRSKFDRDGKSYPILSLEKSMP